MGSSGNSTQWTLMPFASKASASSCVSAWNASRSTGPLSGTPIRLVKNDGSCLNCGLFSWPVHSFGMWRATSVNLPMPLNPKVRPATGSAWYVR